MAVASLVLGIIGLVCSVFGSPVGASWLGSVCGVLAIIFGAVGMKKDSPDRGRAKAGLVLGILSLTLGVILTIACVACITAGGIGFGSALMNYIDTI